MFRVDPDLAGPLMAMVTTMLGQYDGSEMAKVGLQNRLSGANRNHSLREELWQTLLRYSIFQCRMRHKRPRRIDDGYTRIANELLEAVMLAGLTQHQLLVFRLSCAKHMALIKTGLGEQRATFRVDRDIAAQVFCCKSVLVKRGIFIPGGISALIMWSVNGQHCESVRKIKFT
ncbi:hypothetical protein BANRA_04667 [Escherichia coli]|nr:hypothetical protein BANRA_04667 [Escherichia coli]